MVPEKEKVRLLSLKAGSNEATDSEKIFTIRENPYNRRLGTQKPIPLIDISLEINL